MSIDNNAILFVGLYVDDVDLSKLGKSFNKYNLSELPDKHESGIDIHFDNDDYALIGFEIGDSGSYGSVNFYVSEIILKIEESNHKFDAIFGKRPLVFLFNYQC